MSKEQCIYFTDNGVIVEHARPGTLFSDSEGHRTNEFCNYIL